jgi:hypothetical protein
MSELLYALILVWFMVGFLTAMATHMSGGRTFRTAVGMGLIWPVRLIVFLGRAVADALDDMEDVR